ncbi:MAG: helix-turn-helix domain-containing protein [Candidatus Nanoarchaeia archaeon]|nr:helix-turn-helix domain-containing protein [Candidatus Nanoarchaeia archaeon]
MTNDKFILMGLDDERSKYVAEVLGNNTCRKILDFLAETKEASEKDISDGLKIPINTVEYNLDKLIKSGLVEKTKNFFWSSKGKKIVMYKLARKHIIISPNKKFDLNNLKAIMPVLIAAFVIIALALYMNMKDIENNSFSLRDSKTDNSLQAIPASEGASATMETVTALSPNKENTDKINIINKILIAVEILLLLFIIIFGFILFRVKKKTVSFRG